MPFASATPSVEPATFAFSSVIAEEALALLAAFRSYDEEEIRFRTTLLLMYAQDTGKKALAVSSIALLEEVSGAREPSKARMVGAFEQVIAAAADIVAAHGVVDDHDSHVKISGC